MKFKKALQHYFNAHLDAVIVELKKESNEYSIKDFHHIRVAIKKLRAIFDMLAESLKEFHHKKYFAPFKDVFKQVGIIREIQLELQFLSEQKSFRGLTRFKKHLEQQLANEIENFLALREKKKKMIKRYGSKVFAHIDELTKKKATKYMEEQGRQIDEMLLQSGIDAATIHNMRKLLKRYTYLVRSIDEDDTEPGNQDNIDAFQDLLGKWHDNQVMADHLEQFSKNDTTKAEKNALQKISANLIDTAKKQHRQINQFIVKLN